MWTPLANTRRRAVRALGAGAAAWVPTGVDDAALQRIDLLDGRGSANQRQLRRHGLAGWQPGTTAGLLAAWELTAKPGTFFDVGANAGVYALLCRLRWPALAAVAFEPSPDLCAVGRQWADANGVDVVFERAAVSDAEGDGLLYLSSKSDASNSLVAGFRTASGTLAVETVTLDGYVERTGRVPTVVKIDVERHEPAVLRGARRTLERHRPVVVIELLGGEQPRQAHELLGELGYVQRRLDARDRLYWPGQLPQRWPEVFAGWQRAVSRCGPAGWRRGVPRPGGGRRRS